MMDTTHNHPSVIQYTVFNEVCASCGIEMLDLGSAVLR